MRRVLESQTFKTDIGRIRVFRADPKSGPWEGKRGVGGGNAESVRQ